MHETQGLAGGQQLGRGQRVEPLHGRHLLQARQLGGMAQGRAIAEHGRRARQRGGASVGEAIQAQQHRSRHRGRRHLREPALGPGIGLDGALTQLDQQLA